MFPGAYFCRAYFDDEYWPGVASLGALCVASQDVFHPGTEAQDVFAFGSIDQDAC